MKDLYLQAAAQMSADDVRQLQRYRAETSARKGRNTKASASSQNTSINSTANVTINTSSDTAQNTVQNTPRNTPVHNVTDTSLQAASDASPRTRKKQSHDWPEVGTVLYAEYFGERYRATVIKATKKLLSGRQVKLQNGPAAEEVFDSLSAAMLKTTESQRLRMGLRRKGVANGWDFWQWDGK